MSGMENMSRLSYNFKWKLYKIKAKKSNGRLSLLPLHVVITHYESYESYIVEVELSATLLRCLVLKSTL